MKLKKKTYHVQIADMLRDQIMTGKLKEGEKIKESELCSSLGISKTPLREALRVLSVEGLIELVPNRGAFVTKPTLEEIMEMFDVMSLLEGFCARAACQKMSAAEFQQLARLHEKLETHFEHRDQEEYIRINNQYHSFIQKLAGNRTLNQIVNGLRKKILLYRFQSLNLLERFESSIQEHRELLEAFKNRDHQKADSLMQVHLKNQSKALQELAKQSPVTPDRSYRSRR
jgi:DNA-binding GntR family transcriptional regulator